MQLGERELGAAEAALSGPHGRELMNLMRSLSLGQKLPPEAGPSSSVRLARELGWVFDDDRPGLTPTEVGYLVADPLREYLFWEERGRLHHMATEVAALHPAGLRDRDMLEIGCGVGTNLFSMQTLTRSALGVDVEPLYLQFTPLLARIAGVPAPRVICGRAEGLPLDDQSVDLVLCFGALQYMRIERVIAECARVLRRGGRMVAVMSALPAFAAATFKAATRGRVAPKELVRRCCLLGSMVVYPYFGRPFFVREADPVYPTETWMRRWFQRAGLTLNDDETCRLDTETCYVVDKTGGPSPLVSRRDTGVKAGVGVCEAAAGRGRDIVVVSPCRNEAAYMRRTLDSVASQTMQPAMWVVVDDGSTDETPGILEEYAVRLPYLRVVKRADRGKRSVGPGVIEAFYDGLATVDLGRFDYVCKLDLDLELPARYFELLIERMEAEPRLGTCSGKPYFPDPRTGTLTPEVCGDEMSVGMTKLYRVECFRQIGGFVREVMWDGIDCHRCRMLGWTACSFTDPELRFTHLRPMGSSQTGMWTGRKRHGFGQYFMGTGLGYIAASAAFRFFERPVAVGSAAMMWGYLASMVMRRPRYGDREFRRFLRRYQWDALLHGKTAATRRTNERQAAAWRAGVPETRQPVAEGAVA